MAGRRFQRRRLNQQPRAIPKQVTAMPKRHLILLLGLVLLAPLAPTAFAGDIPWSSLSSDQQRILSRARDRWDQLPTERQQRLLRGAQRWEAMTPEQRETARERWRERHQRGREYRERWHREHREPSSQL
jgi:hypothetical protein